MRHAILACLLGVVCVGTVPLHAQTLEFGGYFRSLTGGQDLGYTIPNVEERSAFNGEVARLRWRLALADDVRLTVHNRIQAQFSSGSQTFGTGVTGFGVGVVPRRSLDLESTWAKGAHHRVWHDVDRLALEARAGPLDLTLGRQAISWGFANLFQVADLWTQFSPFELDTEEKRGVDAVRALAYPAPGVELDAVLVDRGNRRNLSGGLRATVELPWGDVYVAGGKFWRQWISFTGVSAVVDVWKIRGEVGLPWSMDGGGRQRLRATVGVDRLGAAHTLSLELHRNGLGADEPADYLQVVQSAAYGRGETYFLGRHYLGFAASYRPTDRTTLGLAVLSNLSDRSASLTPSATYDLGQHARINVGGLVGTGAHPQSGPLAFGLGSEFGTYGRLAYVGLAFYF